MTVLITIPVNNYDTATANRIFDEIVRDFDGVAKTHLSPFENVAYGEAKNSGSAEVNLGEFDLPEPIDYDHYDQLKKMYEQKYDNVAITIESTDPYPIHNMVDINVEGDFNEGSLAT